MSDSKILKHDPLGDADNILRTEYYGRDEAQTEEAPRPRRRKKSNKPKPTHYKVVCISLYTKDIESLEAKVAELKRRGHTKANKSQLIRYALNQLDIDTMPEPNP